MPSKIKFIRDDDEGILKYDKTIPYNIGRCHKVTDERRTGWVKDAEKFDL